MRLIVASLIVLAAALPAAAQKTYEIRQPTGPWRVPGEIQRPRDVWQTPGEIQKPREIWQQPGEIQVPKGIQAVKAVVISGCERRLSVVGDALFDFDKANLRPEAEEMLLSAAPEIRKLDGKPSRVEGHTDSKGGDAYNMRLSEARATTVRDWMAGQGLIPSTRRSGASARRNRRYQIPPRTARTIPKAARRTAASKSCSTRADESLTVRTSRYFVSSVRDWGAKSPALVSGAGVVVTGASWRGRGPPPCCCIDCGIWTVQRTSIDPSLSLFLTGILRRQKAIARHAVLFPGRSAIRKK
jgi:outer membrane protein OmpA-like peptidoglycan-associated protein